MVNDATLLCVKVHTHVNTLPLLLPVLFILLCIYFEGAILLHLYVLVEH